MGQANDFGEHGKKLPIDKLKDGYRLFEDVRGKTGGQLFRAGDVLSEQDINTLRHFGVEHVWVYYTEDMKEKPRVFEIPSSLPAPGARKRILVVDDVESMRRHLRGTLEAAGYDVVGEADDGDAAVDMAKLLKPDLITMDIVMKRLNGIEAARQIKRELPNTKIIMITQAAKPSLVAESIKAGAQNFVIKPYDSAKLAQIVSRTLSV